MRAGERVSGRNGHSAEAIDFEDIWQHRQELHDLCQRIVGDSALADDLVQETYLQVLRNIDRLEVRDGLMPWLVTVAKRRSLNELRRHKYSSTVEAVPESTAPPETDPCEAVALSDQVSRVRDAMAALSERERDLLLRQVYRGMSLDELAAEDESTAASVRSVLNRARNKIRAAVADAGALVLAPFGAAAGWARRRLDSAATRVQEHTAVAPGYARLTEILAAGVMSINLASGPATPVLASAPPTTAVAIPASAEGEAPAERPTPTTLVEANEAPVRAAEVPAPDEPPTTPDPIELLPVDPDDPLPDADEPEEAEYHQFSATPDGQIFALGTTMGKCHVDCSALFHSTDGGATWEALEGSGLMATALLIPPAYPADSRIFAMGPSGLQVSHDGGQTFSSVVGAPAGPAAMSPQFSDGDERILIGSTPPWKYDAASDSGTPMAGVPMSGAETHFAFAPDYGESRRFFVGSFAFTGDRTEPAVYSCRTRLGNETCFRHVSIEGNRAPRIAVSSTFESDGVVFAWAAEGLHRSADGGGSFTSVALPFATVTAVSDDGNGTFFVSGYTTDGAGTTGGVARSTDGGLTWTLLGQGTALAGGSSTVTAVPGGRLLAGPLESAGGGLLCSSNSGATWATRCG